MSGKVREFVQIRGFRSVGELIERLTAARDAIPNGAEARAELIGDDVFGRAVSISYLRAQTAEEAQCDARYQDAYLESLLASLARLQAEAEPATEARPGGAEPPRLAA